jgi:DNA-binding transcriptional LysR family regulator
MTLTQLEVFVTLAECRSFSRAALRLGVTQSAVSHVLRALEKEYGVSLAQREAREFSLTEPGQLLLLRAREMLALASTLGQEMSDAKGLKTGTLRIGSFGPTSTLHLLPPLLAQFKKRYPQVQVRIDEESDEVIDQWLLEKRVEIGFVVLPDERFDVKLLMHDEMVAILPARHPLAKKRSVPVEAFDGLDFALTEAGGRRWSSLFLNAMARGQTSCIASRK